MPGITRNRLVLLLGLIAAASVIACDSNGADVSAAQTSTPIVASSTPPSATTPVSAVSRIDFDNGEFVPLCLPSHLTVVQPVPGFESEHGSIEGQGVELKIARGPMLASNVHAIAGIPPMPVNTEMRNQHIVETLVMGTEIVTLVRPIIPGEGTVGAAIRRNTVDIVISGTDLSEPAEEVALEVLHSLFSSECET